jgi:hypothetical protein
MLNIPNSNKMEINMNIELSKEQLSKMKELKATRQDKTDAELLSQIIDRGLYDLTYRTKRNKQQWQEFKAYKQSLKS